MVAKYRTPMMICLVAVCYLYFVSVCLDWWSKTNRTQVVQTTEQSSINEERRFYVFLWFISVSQFTLAVKRDPPLTLQPVGMVVRAFFWWFVWGLIWAHKYWVWNPDNTCRPTFQSSDHLCFKKCSIPEYQSFDMWVSIDMLMLLSNQNNNGFGLWNGGMVCSGGNLCTMSVSLGKYKIGDPSSKTSS